MLIVDPKLRPSAAQVLQLNCVLSRNINVSRNREASPEAINAFLALTGENPA